MSGNRVPSDDELLELGMSVWEMAESIFDDCKAPADNCIQYNGGNILIFGGSNRIMLDKTGWNASEMHCSERFFALFEHHKPWNF